MKKITVLGSGMVGRARPLDVTSAVLFKRWRLHEIDDEFTIMRNVVYRSKEIE